MSNQEQVSVRKKKADLWEKAIVTSFRDLQWKNLKDRVFCPPSNLELGGNIERAFGDSFAIAGESVFLLEMKSTESQIPDEWSGGEKLSLASLRKKLEGARGKKFSEISSMLHTSLRAHHFLYWSEDSSGFGPEVWPGALVISPYLSEVSLRRMGVNFPELSAFVSASTLAVWDVVGDPPKAVRSSFANRIFEDKVALVSTMATSKKTSEYVKFSLGVAPCVMQEYIEWLLSEQQEQDLPINALLVSRNGNLCRHVSHVSELREILSAIIDNKVRMNLVARCNVEAERLEVLTGVTVIDDGEYEKKSDPEFRNRIAY